MNPWQAINLYRRVQQLAGNADGAVAWDLYSGAGPISMLLASSGYKVAGIEENPFAVEDGKVNLRRNDLEDKVSFITGRVEDKQTDIPNWAQSPSPIVCNPSRRGIAEETRNYLSSVLNHEKSLFIYVSCEIETMARDIKDLQKSGHKLRQVEAFDMFAQTDPGMDRSSFEMIIFINIIISLILELSFESLYILYCAMAVLSSFLARKSLHEIISNPNKLSSMLKLNQALIFLKFQVRAEFC